MGKGTIEKESGAEDRSQMQAELAPPMYRGAYSLPPNEIRRDKRCKHH
jgi:hypothetical protein